MQNLIDEVAINNESEGREDMDEKHRLEFEKNFVNDNSMSCFSQNFSNQLLINPKEFRNEFN